MKRFSDLEMAILGIVYKRAPCTSYAVAREFFASPSSHWRGSAGAVYPAVARLQRLALLKGRRATHLGRPCALFTLTAKGLRTLRTWLLPPLPEAAAAISFDPIRTRAFFLAALTATDQAAFLTDAERQLKAQVPLVEAECQRYRQLGDWFSEQAQHGALYVMKARIAWVRKLRSRLANRQTSEYGPKEKSA